MAKWRGRERNTGRSRAYVTHNISAVMLRIDLCGVGHENAEKQRFSGLIAPHKNQAYSFWVRHSIRQNKEE
jgi:hypothetical protein